MKKPFQKNMNRAIDQSRGAMPGDRPPGNRKPGQNRGPRNGAGPSSNHSGGATSFTAKQKEDISTIRAFGIEEDKLTDEQIVSHMQSTKCRTEQLIDEFYTSECEPFPASSFALLLAFSNPFLNVTLTTAGYI